MPFDAAPLCTVIGQPGGIGGATNTGDATGATLLVCEVSYYSGIAFVGTVVDNVGNVLTARAVHRSTSSNITQVLYDCVTVTHPTGPGWKVTVSSAGGNIFPSIIAQAWKTSLPVSPFDDESGTFSNGATSLAPGSKTPSVAGCLIVSGFAQFDTSGAAANVTGGFQKTNLPAISGTAIGGSLGYLVQGAAAAVNPTWSVPNVAELAVGQVIYKPGAPVVPPDVPVRATQLAAELFRADPAGARMTQVVVELWAPVAAPVRVTQAAAELYDGGAARTLVTQMLVELWVTPAPCFPTDFPVDTVTPGGSCVAEILP
jgi:hypothetical protein